jgi:diguanylate cyclase (GGDEF)-like protein
MSWITEMKLRGNALLFFGILQVVLLGLIDYASGYEISFSIFYLVPITMVAWFAGFRRAFALSLLSAAVWLAADIESGHEYSHFAIPIWNSTMRLGFFLVASYSIATISTLHEKERAVSRSDFLTGLLNSRAFYETATLEMERSGRYHRPFTVVYIDLDNFKAVNDSIGHGGGDVLLRSVGEVLRSNFRSTDLVARMGGDEFAVLMPETDGAQAKSAMDKLHRTLMDEAAAKKWRITFSIGVVSCLEPASMDELLMNADKVMYVAKKGGKNRVEYRSMATMRGAHDQTP